MNVAVKFRVLQISKILNTDTNIILQFLSRLCAYLWDLHSLKNNSSASRPVTCMGRTKIFTWQILLLFLNWRYFSEIHKKEKNNPLLPKSTLKYLVYFQVFWVEVRHLQNQCISIWALVFCYSISNNLPCKKIVMYM